MAQSTVTVKFTPREYRLLRAAVRIAVMAGHGDMESIAAAVQSKTRGEFPNFTEHMRGLLDSL